MSARSALERNGIAGRRGVIETGSGRVVNLDRPTADDVGGDDIARGLSTACRFGGQHGWYSVAQHSLLVHDLVCEREAAPALQLAALLHDGHEAYLGDVPSPQRPLMGAYDRLARRWDKAIATAFGFEAALFGDPVTVDADERALVWEGAHLIKRPSWDWARAEIETEPLPRWHRWDPMLPEEAYEAFGDRLSQAVDRAAASRPGTTEGRSDADGGVLRGRRIREVAVALLADSGRGPIHYVEWLRLVAAEGYEVAGKRPDGVFLNQVIRSPLVRPTTRVGVYEIDRSAVDRLRRRVEQLRTALAKAPAEDLEEMVAELRKALRSLEEAEQVLGRAEADPEGPAQPQTVAARDRVAARR